MPVPEVDPTELSRLISERLETHERPFMVGIDGRSGAGKSTLAAQLAGSLDAALIEGDDFYAGGTEVRADSRASCAAACIDWTRQVSVLERLRSGRPAAWRAFDWDAFDGRLCDVPTHMVPKAVVILEGVYACRPELADLLDLRVLMTVSDDVRLARLHAREGTIGPWEKQWHQAEEFYFASIMPRTAFEIVIPSAGN